MTLETFDRNYIQYLFNIYEFRDSILSYISPKEGIIVSAILGHQVSERERKKYYRTTYLEDGIEIDYSGDDEYTVHSIASLQNILVAWSDSLTSGNCSAVILSWYRDYSTCSRSVDIMLQTIRDQIIVTIKQTEDHEEITQIVQNELVFCTRHSINSIECQKYFQEALSNLLSMFQNYNTKDIVGYSASLYTCVPTTCRRITTFINTRESTLFIDKLGDVEINYVDLE